MTLGEVKLKPNTHYLITLSFFASKVNNFVCYEKEDFSGNSFFSDNQNCLYFEHDSGQKYSHVLKEKIYSGEKEQLKLYTYDNGMGSRYYNILLTA